jgi:flagellar biosynthesis/type III secretory pathway protein FliH
MGFAESFSRADEIDAVRRRTFDALGADELAPSRRLDMHDPQQPAPVPRSDEAMLVVPGSERMTVLVEPVSFESIEDLRREAAVAAAERGGDEGAVAAPAAAPDPAEVARAIVAEARETARTMLRQARDVIAADRASALEQARAEGYAAGRAEVDAEMAGLVATCERIGVHVMEERERVLEENEADVVELAMSIARRIVNASLDVDETLVVEACRGAMRKAFQRGSMQVLAHPQDLELLLAAGPAIAEELGGVDHLDFIAERRLDRGSVVVRTPAGEIDATIDGKAEKIEQALREGIEQRRAARQRSDS